MREYYTKYNNPKDMASIRKTRFYKIGLDLDGVIVDKPPFVPKRVIEWLVRVHANKKLAYRYPNWGFERWVRWFSHYHLFRPPIKTNIVEIHKLRKNKGNKLYLISGRYGFLDARTNEWLAANGLDNYFNRVYINQKNTQPHRFKERMIKKLKLNAYVDDDLALVEYLKKRLPEVKVVHFKKEEGLRGLGRK